MNATRCDLPLRSDEPANAAQLDRRLRHARGAGQRQVELRHGDPGAPAGVLHRDGDLRAGRAAGRRRHAQPAQREARVREAVAERVRRLEPVRVEPAVARRSTPSEYCVSSPAIARVARSGRRPSDLVGLAAGNVRAGARRGRRRRRARARSRCRRRRPGYQASTQRRDAVAPRRQHRPAGLEHDDRARVGRRDLRRSGRPGRRTRPGTRARGTAGRRPRSGQSAATTIATSAAAGGLRRGVRVAAVVVGDAHAVRRRARAIASSARDERETAVTAPDPPPVDERVRAAADHARSSAARDASQRQRAPSVAQQRDPRLRDRAARRAASAPPVDLGVVVAYAARSKNAEREQRAQDRAGRARRRSAAVDEPRQQRAAGAASGV